MADSQNKMDFSPLFQSPQLYLHVALLLLTLYYMYFKVKRWNYVKYAEQIPGDKPLPIIGNAHTLLRMKNLTDLLKVFWNLSQKYSEDGITRFWFGPTLGILIWDPSYIQVIANSPDAIKKGPVYRMMFGEISCGVFTLSGGPKWKELRKPLSKSLAKKYLNDEYLDIFIKSSKKLRDYIMEKKLGEYVDLKPEMCLLTVEMFLDTHFGIHGQEARKTLWDYGSLVDDYFNVATVACLNYCFLSWKSVEKYTKLGQEINDIRKRRVAIFDWIFGTAMKSRSSRKIKDDLEYYGDFILRRAAENNLSKDVMYKEVIDVLIAGSDTTAVMLSSAVLYLAMFPEYQEEAYREMLEIFGDSDRDPTPEDLSRMKYLEMVIKETIRITTAPGIMKGTSGDIKLDKYTIPKNSIIYLFVYAVHRNPRYWERPNSFYPDHFLPDKEQARPQYAYVPFGVGPRMCPGIQYGSNSGLVVLSTLLRSFKVTTKMKPEDLDFEYRLLLTVKAGYPVLFEKRLH